ncbi:MAG: metallophosphoesterase [Bacteroidales bacterium]|jgi:predicted phosphodiesterase
MRNKQIILLVLAVLFLSPIFAQKSTTTEIVFDDGFNFYVANDLGRNGSYFQKDVAEVMGNLADSLDIEFVVAAGDVHHYGGVQSINDPIWMTNYELIYSHGDLQVSWYPILGNHEYRGNTQAVLDYSNVSRRWEMPARYYVKHVVPESDDDYSSVDIFFLDTSPLINKYHEESDKYPDIQKQDTTAQLRWLEKELAQSKAEFKIVVGHHPIYVSEKKRVDEKDLIDKLDPILRRNNVDMYIAGHSHTFQHLTKPNTDIQYIVNGSASLGRKPIKGPDTQFCSSDEGFSVISVGKNVVRMTFINYKGEPIYYFDVKNK